MNTAQANITPLAHRIRPRSLAQFVGQEHILSAGKPLHTAISNKIPHSMILWGPPGTGKTTIAQIIAHTADAAWFSISAVMAGIREIRAAVAKASELKQHGKTAILFVDEVHRFNKSQQDAFLPHIENGTVVFIGATTENPSFELNNSLLSRARIYVLKSLKVDEIKKILTRSLREVELRLSSGQLEKIAVAADGDARRALNFLENCADLAEDNEIADDMLESVISGGIRRFDKGGDEFYNQISALHKSVRGSDPDAALYWFARMIDGGCDPLYIGRRLIRMASEDIGNADPRALNLAIAALNVYERLGSPEGELALAQSTIYLAVAPKSNAVYQAYKLSLQDAREHGSLEVPEHIRNAPTKLMKKLGYGKNYRYAHDEQHAYAAGENYFPPPLKGRSYYHPTARGFEIKIQQKLAALAEYKKTANSLR